MFLIFCIFIIFKNQYATFWFSITIYWYMFKNHKYNKIFVEEINLLKQMILCEVLHVESYIFLGSKLYFI